MSVFKHAVWLYDSLLVILGPDRNIFTVGWVALDFFIFYFLFFETFRILCESFSLCLSLIFYVVSPAGDIFTFSMRYLNIYYTDKKMVLQTAVLPNNKY